MGEVSQKSLKFTVITMFGSFLAIIFAFIIEYFKTEHIKIMDLTEKGEIIIICISLLFNSLYIFHEYRNNNKEDKKLKWPEVFFWGTLTFYTINLAVYIVVKTLGSQIDSVFFVFWYSIFAIIIAFIITLASQYYQNINTDVVNVRQKDNQRLEDDFDVLLQRGE
jgi:hypothetical protein